MSDRATSEPDAPQAVNALVDRLDGMIARLRAGQIVGLYLIQADQANRIGTSFNRTYMKRFCDRFVERLHSVLPKGTLLVPLPERQFAIVYLGASVADIVDTAKSLADSREPRIQIGSKKFAVDLTMGIALYPTLASDGNSLFRRAELSLKIAQDKGLSHELYEPGMSIMQKSLWQFETEIKHAIHRGLLEVYYQPKYEIARHRVCGAEALVRWRNDAGELVPAAAFIKAAENSGAIVPLTWLVFSEIQKAAQEFETVSKPFSLSVNVAPQALTHTEFFSRLSALQVELLRRDVRLTLELTESGFIQTDAASLEILHMIRRLQVGLAIDDFGKGYSSLNYLRRIPATELKIDKEFVRTVALDRKNRQIVKTAIDLAVTFGMDSVAEGVDSEKALAVLADLGCKMAQGYLIAFPMASHVLREWVQKGEFNFARCAAGAVTRGLERGTSS